MSKLIEKLEQASRGAGQTMGFKAAAAASGPSMVLVAALPAKDTGGAEDFAGSQVDALVAYAKKSKHESLEQIARVAGDAPWGVWLDKVTMEGVKQLEEAGGDFVIFEPDHAPAALLQANEIGKVLKVDLAEQDRTLRAVEELAVDAVLIDIAEEDKGPTVSHIMYCRWISGVMSKPLLVAVQPDIAEGDLQALWEGGANGVVVDLKEEQARSRLPDLQQAIKALPARSKRERKQGAALLPRLG